MDEPVRTRVSAYTIAVADALTRELREETGLELDTCRLLDARTYAVHRNGVSWHLTGLFYAVDLTGGAPAVVETEGSTDATAWLPLSELGDSPLSPAAIDALRLLDDLPPRAAAPA
ncbi:NUDIX domain-containing protein [Streptomyces sp. NPDC048636]|uniref:NUDIX domain-containing protein n=1 Tax=Streptomyces sp. NPDC048636 TaxID=3155762 RepID=UPI00341E028F